MKELETKGYLFNDHGNNWVFTEMPDSVVVKTNNENLEVGKNHNENTTSLQEKTTTEVSLQEKTTTQKWEKTTTRCGKKPQEILQDNTYKDNTNSDFSFSEDTASQVSLQEKTTTKFEDFLSQKKEKGSFADPIGVTANELSAFGLSPVNLVSTANGLLRYQDKYLKPIRENFNF